MRRFTVLHVDGEPGLRGGERQLLALAGALRARGHRSIVCTRAGTALESEAGRQGLETRTFPLLGEWDFLSPIKLVSLARREGAIVHAHTAHACATAAWVALAGVPVVMHRRVDFPVSALSVRLKYALAGKIVAVSKAIADILRTAGVAAGKLTVVTDAIPVSPEEARWTGRENVPFRPATPEERKSLRAALENQLGVPAAAPLVGNLAALVPHKDHDTMLAAAVIVCLQRPDVRFVIAGQGPEEDKLRESLKSMGLEGKVLLLGHREDAASLLQALDVYCQSSWGEGMGSVLLEAQACGVPIAATTAGGIPEVVENESTGLLVKPRDPEALAGALLRLLSDAALRARLGQAALERLPRFGLKAAAASMEAVYAAVS